MTDNLNGMSEINRLIAYSAVEQLRKIGYEWIGDKQEWEVPEALIKKNQEDKKNAMRYKFLRLRQMQDDELRFGVIKNVHFDFYNSPEELDLAIDAEL